MTSGRGTPSMWIIEKLECGVWVTLDEADLPSTAMELAGSYLNLPCAPASEAHREEARIQIVTPDGEIL